MKPLEAEWNVTAERWELIDDREEWSINRPRVVGGRIRSIAKTPGFPPMVQIERSGGVKPAWVTFYITESKLGDAREGDSIWATVIPEPHSHSPFLTCIEFGTVGDLRVTRR